MDPKTSNTPRRFDFLPLSIRIETLGGVGTPLVLRGTPLPAKRSQIFSTASDEQSGVEIQVALGESPIFKNNVPFGNFHFDGIPLSKKRSATDTSRVCSGENL